MVHCWFQIKTEKNVLEIYLELLSVFRIVCLSFMGELSCSSRWHQCKNSSLDHDFASASHSVQWSHWSFTKSKRWINCTWILDVLNVSFCCAGFYLSLHCNASKKIKRCHESKNWEENKARNDPLWEYEYDGDGERTKWNRGSAKAIWKT